MANGRERSRPVGRASAVEHLRGRKRIIIGLWRSHSAHHLRSWPATSYSKAGHAGRSRIYAGYGGGCPQQIGLRPRDSAFALSDLDALRERAKMVAPITSIRAA